MTSEGKFWCGGNGLKIALEVIAEAWYSGQSGHADMRRSRFRAYLVNYTSIKRKQDGCNSPLSCDW